MATIHQQSPLDLPCVGGAKPMGYAPEIQRSVSFGNIKVLEFPMELGDNPSVTRGCPLRLGWEMINCTDYDIDIYERFRPDRRSSKQLRIPTTRRTQILLNQGHSLEEITSTALAALKIKDSRLVSSNKRNRNRSIDHLYGALVRAGHRIASQRKFANI